MHRVAIAFLLFAALAGCAESPTNVVDAQTGAPIFAEPLLIDEVRAGGEPVIAVTQAGTILVSAHPGYTHYHTGADPTHVPTEILTPSSAQSYLWRSTDNGTTWTHIGLPSSEDGPRSAGFGVSDPEFTVMESGAICYTDLLALASSSVVCSTDDGQTWLPGNPIASGGPNDRQWLASYGDELYFTANYFADHHLRVSTDLGITWTDRGDVPCSQDLVADPATGALVVACGPGLAVSQDGGLTWSEVRTVPDAPENVPRIMAEPAIDSVGNVWVTYSSGERQLFVAGTPDMGASWPWVVDLTPHVNGLVGSNGTYVWPWVSAGSAGRLAVTWIGAAEEVDSASAAADDPWFLYTAYVNIQANAEPSVAVVQVTPEPLHIGPICQSGTTCQATSVAGRPDGDRRLGDFFETTIDADGYLLATWSNTARNPSDTISHPEFTRQVGGPRLIADEDLGTFMPTQG